MADKDTRISIQWKHATVIQPCTNFSCQFDLACFNPYSNLFNMCPLEFPPGTCIPICSSIEISTSMSAWGNARINSIEELGIQWVAATIRRTQIANPFDNQGIYHPPLHSSMGTKSWLMLNEALIGKAFPPKWPDCHYHFCIIWNFSMFHQSPIPMVLMGLNISLTMLFLFLGWSIPFKM